MTNEWLEYKTYIDTPVFNADSKQSTAFIGRFVRMIKQNKGFSRIFTILARGYLGSATYMESYENKIPDEFMEKKPEMGGVSAVRIKL